MHSRTDDDFMQLAIDQAKIALYNKWIPVGAIFVRDDAVMTHGRKTGEKHTHFDHAEHNACYNALWSRQGPRHLRGVTVYSTLEPCVMCMGMLMTVRVSRIVYALPDPYGGGSYLVKAPRRSRPERFKSELPVLVQASEAVATQVKALMREFFETTDERCWQDPENPLVQLVTAR